VAGRGHAGRVIDRRLRGEQPHTRTPRQVDVLTAFVEAGGSVSEAAARVGIRPSTAKRHLADLRARSGLTTEQLIYCGRAEGCLNVPSLERDGPLNLSVRTESVEPMIAGGGPDATARPMTVLQDFRA